ncbi:hypothetical protein GCM10009830_24650 [Glycomyces endophyticus]|uniref:RNA polymerase sigma-70 region 2 domain-containing protein n=1 Tax=Glycomyces endophyticus TaxID=480996 RepID=A0ABP4SR13_9ACTN
MTMQHIRTPRSRLRADEFTTLLDQLPAFGDGDPGAGVVREEIVIASVPLLHHIAYRFTGQGLPQDQVMEIAAASLNAAVDRYDGTRDGDFLAWAIPRITGEIRRRCRAAR